jgi:hypothetical protein
MLRLVFAKIKIFPKSVFFHRSISNLVECDPSPHVPARAGRKCYLLAHHCVALFYQYRRKLIGEEGGGRRRRRRRSFSKLKLLTRRSRAP